MIAPSNASLSTTWHQSRQNLPCGHSVVYQGASYSSILGFHIWTDLDVNNLFIFLKYPFAFIMYRFNLF